MKFFCLINGTPKNVATKNMKFEVRGEEKALVGAAHDGKSYEPNRAEFREKLPHRWRKSFDRELFFWHDEKRKHCRINLKDRRGKYLATIFCGLEN